MNRHQVLTGAANSGDRCFAVGNVNGVHFTAYAAGCNIVILASDFQRVQIIPSAHGDVGVDLQVSCISCCSDTGKIAASYVDKVCIYEPLPLSEQRSSHKLDYQWHQTKTIQADCEVLALAWNLEGTHLLTAGEVIQMWQTMDQTSGSTSGPPVEFYFDEQDSTSATVSLEWLCVWQCRTANPITLVKFSSDSLLFATIGKDDRMVKIWYEDKKFQLTSSLSQSTNRKLLTDTNYSFIYVVHPRAVTGFSWRHTSKYMHRGTVANMLVTSCKDNICRIWAETVLPDDGLLDARQLDAVSLQSAQLLSTRQHKKRFLQRLHHIRHLLHTRKRPSLGGAVPSATSADVHDGHKYSVHTSCTSPTLHFHLAASINSNTDIPLLGSLNYSAKRNVSAVGVYCNFVVHWLNNKEFYMTLEAEKIAEELARRPGDDQDALSDAGDGGTGSGMTTPAPAVNGILPVSSEASLTGGTKKRVESMQRTKMFMSVDSDKSAGASTAGGASNAGSDVAGQLDSSTKPAGAVDSLDAKIERLIRDWNHGSDMLFSIHPADGSLLVWLVDYLDEALPGSFRQAQVCFSSLIPKAVPTCDAVTMEPYIWLYCDYGRLKLSNLLESEDSGTGSTTESRYRASPAYTANAMGCNSAGRSDNMLTPNVLMLTKHTNGSLNLWQVTFADHSRFSTVLNVAHVSRASGHRFRTSSMACHPVLPLLLTTSHHNSPSASLTQSHVDDVTEFNVHGRRSPRVSAYTEPAIVGSGVSASGCQLSPDSAIMAAMPFCSELILWRVSPVGPLSKSGGLTELARINSPAVSAFTSVAWLPTLLPSSSLGGVHKSPSALFVASDGVSLRVYQALLDARSLLTSSASEQFQDFVTSPGEDSDTEAEMYCEQPSFAVGPLNVVSLQSTSRPGCIIELVPIDDAIQDWRNIELIHIFQEQLITGSRLLTADRRSQNNLEGLVNLQNATTFDEHFFLVVVERAEAGSSTSSCCTIHMWCIVISSQADDASENGSDAGDADNSADKDGLSRANSISSKLHIITNKVCTQVLSLPPGVVVNSASVAAGHLSSASIYPACFAPYLLTTACSDGHVHFWRCELTSPGEDAPLQSLKYVWKEWEMMIPKEINSSIHVPGQALLASCAYSGRVAVAYMSDFTRPHPSDASKRLINLFVTVYECESTGGSEWTLEDTIRLRNVEVPSTSCNGYVNGDISPPCGITVTDTSSDAEPTATSKFQIRRIVQLDWASTEDGGHVLTVGVGSCIWLYAAVPGDVAMTLQTPDERTLARAPQPSRGVLQKSKSMAVHSNAEAAAAACERRWVEIRTIKLTTADGRPPMPLNISWVRSGILVVGLDSEMHVYSQWHCPTSTDDMLPSNTAMATTAAAQVSSPVPPSTSFLLTPSSGLPKSMSAMKRDASIASLSLLAEKDRRRGASVTRSSISAENSSAMKKSGSIDSFRAAIRDCGLFEAARRASPCLPQYHPRQLIELLNFGKIRRVKAILAHLLRCIAGSSTGAVTVDSGLGSVDPTGTTGTLDEHSPNYVEISSIPALPLYALLAADSAVPSHELDHKPGTASRAAADQRTPDYTTLFTTETNADDALDNPLEDTDAGTATRVPAVDSTSPASTANKLEFTPAQAHLLVRHLTHTQLPGLSSLDQMYLLAVAETVANTKVDFSSSGFTASAGMTQPSSAQTNAPVAEAIDDCGLRFLLASRHHVYLLNTLPLRQRAQMQQLGLSPAYYVWAFHSESQDELLNSLPCMQKGAPMWAEMRQFGVGWWLRNINSLQRCAEKLAKAAFQASKDPLDAAVFYLAMKKKSLLWGLFRSVNEVKMAQFFKNNFAEDRWRKAALKNAFSLLGKQKFERAAAFFLLGGAVKDAIEVCLNKLEDIQLAFVILRLYESDLEASYPPRFCQLLREECLGYDPSISSYDPDRMSPDPFVRSMAYWILKDYTASLSTLLEGDLAKRGQDTAVDIYASGPTSVFNFYNYLRTHPLIVRQHLATSAAATEASQKVLLSGFSHSGAAAVANDKNVTYIDRITPVERRLYFTTAHAHFVAGCPALALEVLIKLPASVVQETDGSQHSSSLSSPKVTTDSKLIRTGTLEHDDSTSSGFDWSRPAAASSQAGDLFDWSHSSTRFEEEKLELDWHSDKEDDDEQELKLPTTELLSQKASDADQRHDEYRVKTGGPSDGIGDIMAHQLKFIACMKIMVDELSTLATGFEVDGGQLRYQLYTWLEKEVEVLKRLSSYMMESDVHRDASHSARASKALADEAGDEADQSGVATLSEVILAEQSDFDAKLLRLACRRRWLKSNKALLRTLLSFSVLHGACGGGLVSMRMELLLLLQELQQQPTNQKLLTTPVPLPTSLPLLSACIAPSKTVVSDPIEHLYSMTYDLLHTIVECHAPPDTKTNPNKMLLMRNLSVALSACIYQCLCDSDSVAVSATDAATSSYSVSVEGYTSTNVLYKDSHLMAGMMRQQKHRHRHNSAVAPEIPNSLPSKWPGVSAFRAIINKHRDSNMPKLNVLLCETLVAVYVSWLSYALALYDANMLYRLVGHSFHESIWELLFGGCCKKQVVVSTPNPSEQQGQSGQNVAGMKRRNSYIQNVIGHTAVTTRFQDSRTVMQEKFVPPRTSMATYFMTKVTSSDHPRVDYDSAESISSLDEEDDDDDELAGTSRRNESSLNEHLDSNSYSWCLMRYALVKYVRHSFVTFIPQIGIELNELPVCSPLVNSVHKILEQWETDLKDRLEKFDSAPADYIPGVYIEPSFGTSVTIVKYHTIMDPANTPFTSSHYSTRPAKRLWNYLVTRDYLQDVFIRYIFRKQRSMSELECAKPDTVSISSTGSDAADAMKIIHKEQDMLTCFCVNETADMLNKCLSRSSLHSANLSSLVVATQKELLELDITNVLHPPPFIHDDIEFDIEVIRNPTNVQNADELLVTRTPFDSRLYGRGMSGPGIGVSSPTSGSSILLKRPVSGVRRMAAHPILPYYLTGSKDGTVRLWEWGHMDCINEPRKPGAFPKVTKVLFNAQGNKFGVSDTEGGVCLWQVGLGLGSLGMNKPYLSFKCHSKVTSDFVFVGSSSLIATAGHSADNRNVCLWDTLLPQRRSLVQAFQCHPDGCPMVLYAPQHQVLISGGKKGEVCIFDVRQRQLRQMFQAHETNVAIRCLALDSGTGAEECFVTGSSDGDIKVWSLAVHNLMYSFPGEHSKGSSSLFRSAGSGVTQLYLSSQGHLFSSGADGSLKVRQLVHRRQAQSAAGSLTTSSR